VETDFYKEVIEGNIKGVTEVTGMWRKMLETTG
jgi:hypothetical protein